MQKQKIIDSIADVLEITAEEVAALDEEEPLSEHGMDSLHFIQLVVLIEEALDIEILDSDLLIENFSCKNKISATLEKYLKP